MSNPEVFLEPGHEDDDEMELIAAIGAAWDAHGCECGHARREHPNWDMRDPTRNSCRVKGCDCRWFQVVEAPHV